MTTHDLVAALDEVIRRATMAKDSALNGDFEKCLIRLDQIKSFLVEAEKCYVGAKAHGDILEANRSLT